MIEQESGRRSFTRYERVQLVLLAIAAILMTGLFYYRWRKAHEPVDLRQELAEAGPRLKVQIKGDVEHPGVYEMPLGSNVSDLIHQSGPAPTLGALPSAWRDIPLFEGGMVEIWQSQDGQPRMSINRMKGDTLGLLFIHLDVNEASVEDLKTLPGIGDRTAQAIVEYRQKHGPFKRLEDLAEVDGIGEKTVEALRYRVAVGQPVGRGGTGGAADPARVKSAPRP
jgi:competence protein ComEA